MNAAHPLIATPAAASWHRGPAWLLRVVLVVEVLVYFGAAALHLGLRLALGPVALAAPHVLVAAAVAESLIGIVVVANLTAVLAGVRRIRAITLGAHVFALLGVLLGLWVLAAGTGLGLDINFDLHYLMLVGIAAVFGLLLLPRPAGG